MTQLDVYGGRDPRELPAYTYREAALYASLPIATFRSWVLGRHYPTEHGRRFFEPIIVRPDQSKSMVSFYNLVEGHVLAAIRQQHLIALHTVRRALDFVSEEFGTEHPLVYHEFQTDGVDLFVEYYGQLINASQQGQTMMRDVMKVYLRRIEHDQRGMALRLYPFTRSAEQDEPKVIVIDPRISFGRSVLRGTGIPTAVIADRYWAGESVDDLAEDYGRQKIEIEEAIRLERRAA